MQIERQSEHYSFVDPELARTAERYEAAEEIPADAVVESFLSGPRITAGMHDHRGRGTGFDRAPVREGRGVTASNDPDLDLFFELSNQGMSMDDIGKEIAQRNYTDNEERKAFRKGWRSGFTGKDATHYDNLTDGWPSNLYHAFFSAYEIVRTYW